MVARTTAAPADRLAEGLRARGPLFAAFGRYLATRIDVVPEPICAALATIPDASPRSDPDAVRETFVRELGRAPEWAFASFDPAPFECRLFWQAHNARIGAVDVVVKVQHPRNAVELRNEASLDELEAPLAALGVAPETFRLALADFRGLLPAVTSFTQEAHTAAQLAQDARAFDALGAPRIWAHLSTASIFVYERCDGIAEPGATDPDRCRSVCLAWLRQALQGVAFPVEPSPANIGITREGRVVFHGGPYTCLDERARRELQQYLIAVAAGEVDEAATRLDAALALRPDSARAALRREIRQMAPFRDGYRGMTPEPRHAESSFTEEVLIHWRIAAQCGAGGTFTSFYRGFFTIACTAQMLMPGGRDAMAEALRDLRVMGAFREIQELVRPSEAPAMFENFAVTMMRMPDDVDRLLTALAAGNYPASPRRQAGAPPSRSAGLLCIGLALAAGAISAHRLADHAAIRQLAAAIFLAAGLLVLWAAARRA